MTDFFSYQEIASYFTTLPRLELLAVVVSLMYVVLAARGNIWCWPAAFISTALYSFIFYDYYLLMDSLLQVYYLIMAVYGWYCWNQTSKVLGDKSQSVLNSVTIFVQSKTIKFHLQSILVLSFCSVFIGWFMATYTPADFPYMDATTTVFSVFATYLITKKVLENWLYWCVIDLVSIYIYLEKGLTPTAVLFVLYTIIAVYGYFSWRKQRTQISSLSLPIKNIQAVEK